MKKNKFENISVFFQENFLENIFCDFNFSLNCFFVNMKGVGRIVDYLIGNNIGVVSVFLFVFILSSIFASFVL